MSKYIKYNQAGRENILEGVKILAETVAVTMGPMGRNVILGKPVGAPTITKDGVSVAREITLEDPMKELGCQLIKEVAGRTADVAGDGTTTATVLAYEIFKNGMSIIDKNTCNPIHLRYGVNWATNRVIEELVKMSKPIDSDEELINVATISANNDSKLGRVIADAYINVGKDGLVIAEAVPGVEHSVRTVEGIELKSGYINSGFLEKGSSKVELNNCRILICDREITHISDNPSLFNELSASNRSLLVLCKDLKKEALKIFVGNLAAGRLNVCAVKIPSFGSNNDAWLEDLASLTNTVIVGEDRGRPLSEVKMSDLGFAKRIDIDKYSTRIIKPEKNEKRILETIAGYKSQLDTLIGDIERRDIRSRMAFLTSKASVISVGYNTELELRETGDRVDDAMSAVRAAIDEGYVIGGGLALLRASSRVSLRDLDKSYHEGANMLLSSISKPAAQILLNAYVDSESILSQVLKKGSDTFGYNCATGMFGDMIEMGVIDPVKVTRTALSNAVSISLLLLMTDAVVADMPDTETSWQPPAGWRMPSNTNLNHNY